jgi:mannose-6-phosphate isomerase-like protein (cupin superfamily)
MPSLVPIHAPATRGEPFDFGTHANDFLVKREQARSTETFLVRVPGLGAVPEHMHSDMEQTFVFLSGVGTATIRRDGNQVAYRCLPGDTVFVPVGWHHSVAADSLEGVTYVTVNAFLPDTDRVGGTAIAHAEEVNTAFAEVFAAGRSERQADETVLFRCAETAFRWDGPAGAWVQDFTSLITTLTGSPEAYRVERIGPFEIARAVIPVAAVLTRSLADEIHAAVVGLAPVVVEGSQSPLSVKPPYAGSDLDLLVMVRHPDELTVASKTVRALDAVADRVPVPLAVGMVYQPWLALPGFYSVVSIDPGHDDRRWFSAAKPDRLVEATRRLKAGLATVRDQARMTEMFQSTVALAGLDHDLVREWRVTPRWRGLDVLEPLT